MSHAWVAVCDDCHWLGDDHPDDEQAAISDAEMHSRGQRHPWEPEKIVPWDPRKRPIPEDAG
jgi:hypothetical protein